MIENFLQHIHAVFEYPAWILIRLSSEAELDELLTCEGRVIDASERGEQYVPISSLVYTIRRPQGKPVVFLDPTRGWGEKHRDKILENPHNLYLLIRDQQGRYTRLDVKIPKKLSKVVVGVLCPPHPK